jgi:hypothetical protein
MANNCGCKVEAVRQHRQHRRQRRMPRFFFQVGQSVLLLWTQWSGVPRQETPRGALWGRRWPACVEGEAEVLLPGRAPYAVAIEPRQHGSFGSYGIAQET